MQEANPRPPPRALWKATSNLQLPKKSHLHYGSARVELAKTNRRVCKWSLRKVPRCHRHHRSRAYMAQLSQRFKIVAQNLMQRGFTASCIPREQGRSGGGATADSGDDGSCRRLLRPSPWPAAPRRQLLKRSSIQLPSSQTPSWHSSFCSIGLRFR